MSQEFVIRPALPSDAAVVAEFNQRLALETEDLRLDPATLRSGVEAVLKDPSKGVYFVAEAEGRVVGQCSITFEWSDWRDGNFWWLQSVYVDAAWRARGIFRGLYDHVRTAAKAAGVVGLRLYVEETNTTAQAVYARRGMHRTGYQVFEEVWPLSERRLAARTPTN